MKILLRDQTLAAHSLRLVELPETERLTYTNELVY